MIIGENREAVIANIRTAAENGDFHVKVEIGDPVLSDAEKNAIVQRYLARRKTAAYRAKSFVARQMANAATYALNRDTEIDGFEKATAVRGGAILTSNHFGPTDNTVVRHLTKKLGKKRIHIVSQETNLAMPGMFGFLMNYADIIPITGNLHYIRSDFPAVLSELLGKGEFILIYPEQEMWFNYRKPRPPMPGAYHYAAKFGVPILSCFVEMRDKEKADTEEFLQVQYVMHVLEVLYPDPEKSVRENTESMRARDFALKKAAYEDAYGKPLTYAFENSDIAGWIAGGGHEKRA
ncbi:MAG: 1-acyl-sn-glycerol-3-phosphate acyltransferase [Clostridia bacterium]|nr:1-acyl-sn-glycerol-3-phosphate acyltransferase [Clostridia bacterium]